MVTNLSLQQQAILLKYLLMWSQILWLANPYATAHIPRSHQDRHIDQQSTTGHLAQSSLSTIKQTVVF